ncbi:MAG TPA: DUF4124 domain-containing protein [Candidatus Omnitrophica bacterium]|nr:DUF4124 domain-containing protein [Candidatus Omnitrophota bacterium]
MRIIIYILCLVLFVVFPSVIYADTYKYRDDKGKIHFVIFVSDIPERYRDRAVKVEVSRGRSSASREVEDKI